MKISLVAAIAQNNAIGKKTTICCGIYLPILRILKTQQAVILF